VLEAAEAQAALALLEDGEAIDLLFVDLVLPGTLDGHALALEAIDLASRRLVAPDGKEVTLTTGEFDLLAVFVQHPNRVLSRDQLLALTRHREAGPFDRSIDAQVGRLRRKIESDPERPVLIKSVRAAGYVFTSCVKRDGEP